MGKERQCSEMTFFNEGKASVYDRYSERDEYWKVEGIVNVCSQVRKHKDRPSVTWLVVLAGVWKQEVEIKLES